MSWCFLLETPNSGSLQYVPQYPVSDDIDIAPPLLCTSVTGYVTDTPLLVASFTTPTTGQWSNTAFPATTWNVHTYISCNYNDRACFECQVFYVDPSTGASTVLYATVAPNAYVPVESNGVQDYVYSIAMPAFTLPSPSTQITINVIAYFTRFCNFTLHANSTYPSRLEAPCIPVYASFTELLSSDAPEPDGWVDQRSGFTEGTGDGDGGYVA